MQLVSAHASAILAVLALLASCNSMNSINTSTSAGEVESAHQNLAMAYSACDEPAFLGAYAEDFSFVTSNTPSTIRSKDGLRVYLAAGCRMKPNPTASITRQSVHFVGAEAVVTGQYLFRVPAGSKIADVPQNFTVVFIRQSGSWKVAAHHVSLAP
jgi:ketosteroid isomerase-like protein